MKLFVCLWIITASVLTGSAIASNIRPVEPVENKGWVVSIGGGPVWANAGGTQTFYLSPSIEKTYSAQKAHNVFVSGELFVGRQKQLFAQWLTQFGLVVATTNNVNLQGSIWDDADPQFNNHNYQYSLRNTRLALKGKLLFDKNYGWMPWVSGSIGVGFNRAHAFTNTPLIFEALPNANFKNHTETTLTYTLGLGVQKIINKHCRFGVGYEFADWGKSHLGRASGQTLNTGLKLSHLYSNGMLFTLTYLA